MRYLAIILVSILYSSAEAQIGRIQQGASRNRIMKAETRWQLLEAGRHRYASVEKIGERRLPDSSVGVYKGRFVLSASYISTWLSRKIQSVPDTLTFINLPDNKSSWNAGVHYFLKDHWVAGMSIAGTVIQKAIQPIELSFERPRRVSVVGRGNGGVVIICTGSMQYYFLKGNIQPYLSAGLGGVFILLKGVKVEKNILTGESIQHTMIKGNAVLLQNEGGICARVFDKWLVKCSIQSILGSKFNKPMGGIDAYSGIAVAAGVSYLFKK
jgi:hypothetical protein